MADNTEAMILRSYHLPQSMDDDLRGIAFALRCSKADLVRFSVHEGLKILRNRFGDDWTYWSKEDRAAALDDVLATGGSEAVKQARQDDINKLKAPAAAPALATGR